MNMTYSKDDILIVYNDLCNEFEELLNLTKKYINCSEKSIVTEEVIREICKNRQKPIAMPFFGFKKINDEIRRICDLYIAASILAPICYEEFFKLDKDLAIITMDRYIIATHVLNEIDRSAPIKSYMKQPWSKEIFDRNLATFVEKVIPLITKYNLKEEFGDNGIMIDISRLDENENVGELVIQIFFKWGANKIEHYSHEKIKNCLGEASRSNIDRTIDHTYKDTDRTNESELLTFHKCIYGDGYMDMIRTLFKGDRN